MSHPHLIETPERAREFIVAGNATVTLKSLTTGNRFTYKVTKVKDSSGMFFVGLMNGPDNENSYQYIGFIKEHFAGPRFTHGRKSRVGHDAPSVRAFDWVWKKLVQGSMPAQLQIWHEGRCGRCNRKLTVPESIKTGMGPECAGRAGITGMKNFFSEEA